MSPVILLLQARDPDDPAKVEEHRSFAIKSGLAGEHIVLHDLLAGPPGREQLRRVDALMIGGSGDYYVSKGNLPYFQAVLEFLNEVVDDGFPLLASCFGFQLLVKALGGDIQYDADRMEVGTYEITLTPQGREDELLGYLPPRFPAQLGHKDRATRLPQSCVPLAASRLCPYQALRIPGKPIWATQFHPELNVEENRRRFRQYVAGYAVHLSEEQRDAALARFQDSPDTEQLIRRFLQLVLA